MTKPKSADQCGIGEYYKVRLHLPGGVMHLASSIEPKVHMRNGRVADVELDLIIDTEHGDTIGFIDWGVVTAVAWRRA